MDGVGPVSTPTAGVRSATATTADGVFDGLLALLFAGTFAAGTLPTDPPATATHAHDGDGLPGGDGTAPAGGGFAPVWPAAAAHPGLPAAGPVPAARGPGEGARSLDRAAPTAPVPGSAPPASSAIAGPDGPVAPPFAAGAQTAGSGSPGGSSPPPDGRVSADATLPTDPAAKPAAHPLATTSAKMRGVHPDAADSDPPLARRTAEAGSTPVVAPGGFATTVRNAATASATRPVAASRPAGPGAGPSDPATLRPGDAAATSRAEDPLGPTLPPPAPGLDGPPSAAPGSFTATAPAARPVPQVPLADLAPVILRAAARGEQTLLVRIEPPALGQLEIGLRLDPRGRLEVTLRPRRVDALARLEAERPALERLLAAHGGGDATVRLELADGDPGEDGGRGRDRHPRTAGAASFARVLDGLVDVRI